MDRIDELKEKIAQSFEWYGDKKTLVSSRVTYTGTELAEHVRKETDVGLRMMTNMMSLALTLIRSKQKQQNDD